MTRHLTFIISIIVVLLSGPVSAKPRISDVESACVDGFCIEISGADLLSSGPVLADREGRYQSSYINLYRGDDSTQRIGRVYRHQFLEAARNRGEDTIVIDLASPELERAFVLDGLHVEVVNPEVEEKRKWTDRRRLLWDMNSVVLCVTFDEHGPGQYSNDEIKDDFFRSSRDRGWLRSVASERSVLARASPSIPGEYRKRNQTLSASNPEGAWGPLGTTAAGGRTGGGLTFSTLICRSGDCNRDGRSGAFTQERGFEELFMSYWIRFEGLDGGDFDFRRGGKLPGLAGGQTAVASGGGFKGVLPDGRNGWSARATFASSGRAHQYLYYPDNTNPMAGDLQYGENRTWMKNGAEFKFSSNKWYRVLQRIKMNSVDATSGQGLPNGVVQVWVDNDLVLNEQAIRFRNSASLVHQVDEPPFHVGKLLDIDTIAWGLFHGGGTPGHAPLKDVQFEVDDLLVFEPRSISGDVNHLDSCRRR